MSAGLRYNRRDTDCPQDPDRYRWAWKDSQVRSSILRIGGLSLSVLRGRRHDDEPMLRIVLLCVGDREFTWRFTRRRVDVLAHMGTKAGW